MSPDEWMALRLRIPLRLRPGTHEWAALGESCDIERVLIGPGVFLLAVLMPVAYAGMVGQAVYDLAQCVRSMGAP